MPSGGGVQSIGYKLHVDTADGGIPISCIMTSASTHDSQVAIPLGTLTAGRVENLYDLMDAAYDSIEIWAHSILLGHKPIVDVVKRVSSPPIGALTDCFSAIRGGQFSALNNSCANADPTMVAIKIAPIAVRGRRC